MNNMQSRIKYLNTITRSNPNLVKPCYCKKAAKKMPAEKPEIFPGFIRFSALLF